MPGLSTGPAPKPDGQRRRRNPTLPMVRLPAEGRKGRAPKWPLPPDVRIKAQLQSARQARRMLEAQLDGDSPPRGGHARLAKLDQLIAELQARLRASVKIEAELWRELWRTPQAVVWEKLRWTRTVAQYARWKVAAELGDLDASKEARQLEDRLGLNPLAMLRLRWEIVTDEVAEQREEKAGRVAAASARRRLKVVDPGVEGA